MTRIFYISRVNLSSQRTNVYNLAKTCEALNSRENFSAALITSDRSKDTHAFFEHMGVREPFVVFCLGATNSESKYNSSKLFQRLMIIWANIRMAIFLVRNMRQYDLVYYRDESLCPAATLIQWIFRKKVIFEIHSVLRQKYHQYVNQWSIRSANGVVAISSGLKDYYEKFNKKILISLCSAADDEWFGKEDSQWECRKKLSLPLSDFIIGYTGVVGANPNNDFYELDDIVRSLESLPKEIVFVIVGEMNGNAQWLRRTAEERRVSDRVIIIPWQERRIIPYYLKAFDVNVVPKRKKDLVGDSPAKMFPPMASGTPIVAGHAECIEEVLTHNKDSLIVETNTPEGWAGAILSIYNNRDIGRKIAEGAKETRKKYTWEKRGESIANFISQTIKNDASE